MSTRRRVLRWGLGLAGVAIAAAGLALWSYAVYVGLVRLQVRVDDACARVEAASRSRAELAANVIHSLEAAESPAADRLASLRRAADRATETILAPPMLEAPEPFEEFLQAQDALTTALDELWTTLPARPSGGAPLLVEEMRSSVDQAQRSLVSCLDDLERTVDAYHASSRRFPGSVIAGMAKADRFSGRPAWATRRDRRQHADSR